MSTFRVVVRGKNRLLHFMAWLAFALGTSIFAGLVSGLLPLGAFAVQMARYGVVFGVAGFFLPAKHYMVAIALAFVRIRAVAEATALPKLRGALDAVSSEEEEALAEVAARESR